MRERMPRGRLLQLLRECVRLVQEFVTVDPRVAEEPLNDFLEDVSASPTEVEWLGPRLSAYASGFAHGHVAGQLHRDSCLWQHPHEHIEDRRN